MDQTMKLYVRVEYIYLSSLKNILCSAQLNKELSIVDAVLGRFLGYLEEKGLKGQTNVIVVSDHGESTLLVSTLLPYHACLT